MVGIHASTPDAVLDALFLPFSDGRLRLPGDGSVLFLRARNGYRLREVAQSGWLCEQSFKPFADALMRDGFTVGEAAPEARFARVLVLPPRQREEARALFARAAHHAEGGGHRSGLRSQRRGCEIRAVRPYCVTRIGEPSFEAQMPRVLGCFTGVIVRSIPARVVART